MDIQKIIKNKRYFGLIAVISYMIIFSKIYYHIYLIDTAHICFCIYMSVEGYENLVEKGNILKGTISLIISILLLAILVKRNLISGFI
ncbi:MAG: hypothetical protein N4A54_14610 [Peptostreptococcaceae bacterium]|jgi:hypothetical protein|nr:hypothetical protein [Peptostreptococcaceae bacterium]